MVSDNYVTFYCFSKLFILKLDSHCNHLNIQILFHFPILANVYPYYVIIMKNLNANNNNVKLLYFAKVLILFPFVNYFIFLLQQFHLDFILFSLCTTFLWFSCLEETTIYWSNDEQHILQQISKPFLHHFKNILWKRRYNQRKDGQTWMTSLMWKENTGNEVGLDSQNVIFRKHWIQAKI